MSARMRRTQIMAPGTAPATATPMPTMPRGIPTAPLRAEDLPASETYVDMASRELETVLTYWGYRPEMWRLIGFTPAVRGQSYAVSGGAHPIVEIAQSPIVVRRQALGLSERDTVARHRFMRYLDTRGLPLPSLVSRPDDSTYAVVPVVPLTDPEQPRGSAYVIEHATYEVQTFVPGRRYVTDGPAEDVYLEAAARTLAALHLASEAYAGPHHSWPRERTIRVIADAYLARIAAAGENQGVANVPRPIALGLRRLARQGAALVTDAARRLDTQPALPRLHIHGDYQPHNLGFAGDRVCAIYDFEATHVDLRVLEVAYALLAFAGLRWDDDTPTGAPSPTPPLVEQGLDLERARAFLAAYGQDAVPQPGEADVLGDALLIVAPIFFANGVAEDLVFVDREPHHIHSSRECRTHLAWAETFPEWITEHRMALSEAWQRAATGA